jgi:ATP-dependent helicase HrpA
MSVDQEAIHTALAAGLLSHIGARIERDTKRAAAGNERKRKALKEYQGTRGTTFALWPGSVLAKPGAPVVLAAELVETSRLWARTVAAVKPDWIEAVGGDLLRRSYSEPHWSGKRQAVMATEKVMLLGVTLIAARAVSYDRIDPEISRELMIRHGLMAGEMTLPLPFLDANMAALDDVAESERRARRRDIVIDDDALYALYDRYIPGDVTSGRRLEAWWRKASRADPTLLHFTPDMLVAAGAELARRDEYPDRLTAGGTTLDLDYVFEPGAVEDGVTATVPLAALASIDPSSLPAQVPGLRRDVALALIMSLPKQLRRAFVPAPDFADAALTRIGGATGALPDRLAEALTAMTGIAVTPRDFDYSKVPDHLRMRFTVVDDKGRTVASGDDLTAIQRTLAPDTRRAVAKVSSTLERSGLTAFPAEGLARQTSGTAGGARVTGYPALVDADGSVAIRVFTDPADQTRAMRGGTRRLLAMALDGQITGLAGRVRQWATPRGPSAPGSKPTLTPQDLLLLSTAPHGSLPGLVADAADAAIDALLDWAGGPAWDTAAFAALTARISGQLDRAVADILAATAVVLKAGAEADAAIAALSDTALRKELRRERDRWLAPGFLAAVTARHLPDLTRYLSALAIRAERAHDRPERDQERAAEIAALQRALDAREAEMRPERRGDSDVAAARRLIAEYRIALFAQPMKTAVPVSAKRIQAAIAALPD